MQREQLKTILARVACFLLALAVALPLQYAAAWTQYPVTAQIGTGDITSAMIRNGDIVNIDISASALIDAFKIFAGDTGGQLLFSSFGRLGTSTALTFATSTARLGISSSTPARTLSVQGDALVSGTLTAGTITATSSLSAPDGSITSAMIADNSIVGADISAGASTTLANLNTATLYATSSATINNPTLTGTLTA
ncbi:MAG: hypothetical protein AAB964_00450, partial [Patescibacteria group bacterium]